MKVILDISWLGYDETRVGLWRAIESLAVRLARHPDCDVRFSAYKSRGVANRTRRYLTSHRRSQAKP